jgi:phosphate:Na+ symporter
VRAVLGFWALGAGVVCLSRGLARRRGAPPAAPRWLVRAPGFGAAAAAGALLTVLLQSSSLVVIGLMTLADAGSLPIGTAWAAVAGANVGTALVPELLAWRPPAAAYVLAAAGALALALGPRTRRAAWVVAGALGLYLGLELLGGASRGVVPAVWPTGGWAAYGAGVVSTAALFSSAVTVAVAARLARDGTIPLAAALAFVLGANVGTTADVVAASLACRRRGRLVAGWHLACNGIASLVCLPWVGALAGWAGRAGLPAGPAVGHFHLAFNLAMALAALPAAAAGARRAEAWAPPRAR